MWLAFALVVLVLGWETIAQFGLLVIATAVVTVPLSAATDRLERLRVPRGVGAPLLMLAVLVAAGALVALSVPLLADQLDALVARLPAVVDELRAGLGLSSDRSLGQDVQELLERYVDEPSLLLGPLATIGSSVLSALTALVVVIITSIYCAIDPGGLQRGMLRLLPVAERDRARTALSRIRTAYLGWFAGLGVGMVVQGIVTYAGLAIVGLPYTFAFALLTAVSIVIPYFGALLTTIPPVVLALTISPGTAVAVAVVYLIAHQFEGNVVEPVVMGKAVKLHPAVVALGVIALGQTLGFAALVVSVPVLVTIKIAVEAFWIERIEPWPQPPDR